MTVLPSSTATTKAPDILERLRKQAADVIDWHGQTMKEWDKIRGVVETHKGSDLPRLMFEGLVESLAELMTEGADEIETQRRNVRHWREECGKRAGSRPAAQACPDCGGDGHIQTHADGRSIECPNCHNANKYGDYEGPTCEVCMGDGVVAAQAGPDLRAAAERVCWFDWSDNDMDAVAAVEALRKVIAAPQPASNAYAPLTVTDEMLNAHIKALGNWAEPFTAERESGVAVDGDITQEDADFFNEEERKRLRLGYAAALSVSSTDRAYPDPADRWEGWPEPPMRGGK